MTNETQTTTIQSEGGHGSLLSYVSGFVLSIVLTLIAYFLVDQHVHSGHETFSHEFLYAAVVGLAIVQLVIQLIFFLHLGRDSKPHWNLIVFVYAALLLVIIVVGSLWVMAHLNYNMMQMPPTQVDTYMMNQ